MVSADTGPEATIDALLSVTPYFRIPMPRAKAILREVAAAVATWRDAGRKLGMTGPEPEAFAEAFEHSESRAAREVCG
ncbi:MAG TPA: hypothetical protein VK163_05230 [Opitutaceae bacterium]|nr:hypothetical protein [Opitutaceae bacterium]